MKKRIVYLIYNVINSDAYVGSSSKTIEQRLKQHKWDSRREVKKHYKLYRGVVEVGGWVNVRYFTLVEMVCTKPQIVRQERSCVDLFQTTLNENVPGALLNDDDEVDKLAYMLEYSKKYRVDNAVVISAQKRDYYLNNVERINKPSTCECGQSTIRNKSRHKKSRTHIEIIRLKHLDKDVYSPPAESTEELTISKENVSST